MRPPHGQFVSDRQQGDQCARHGAATTVKNSNLCERKCSQKMSVIDSTSPVTKDSDAQKLLTLKCVQSEQTGTEERR